MRENAIFSYFPDNFAHKSISEPFIAFIMSKYLEIDLDMWEQGDPKHSLPDYIANQHYYEFTLASDRCKNNLIRRLQTVTYNSTNIAKDAWTFIQESLDSKMQKNYSVTDVSVCILCLLDFNEANVQSDGSMSADLFNAFHAQIYDALKHEYVDKGKFENVYIIFPFSNETWWVMDVIKRAIKPVHLSEKEIKSGRYPFYSRNQDYYSYFASQG